jgi:alpha-L-fucosidase
MTQRDDSKTGTTLGDSPDMWGAARVRGDGGERGAWFREGRFALFIHWGLYSEAAGIWNGRTHYAIAEWLMHAARIPARDYATLAARFNPVDFDAAAWVRLAQEAGMKYVVITAKHHDGFAMFKSKASGFNVVDATPFGRDPIRELADACRQAGLKLGFYYSQFQDWHEPDAGGNSWDFSVPGDFSRYLREKALPQIRELLTNVGPVGLIWFDTPGQISPEASRDLLDLVRSLQPDCLVNSRIGNGLGDYATLGDQEVPLTAPEGLWETIDTHNDTWGYALNDHNWKSARELIGRLARLVSLGGNYMLNVGPTGKGVIPEASASILREVGVWLRKNGNSIYGAGRSPVGLQPWGCSTRRGSSLYLHLLNWPSNGLVRVPGLDGVSEKARFLATGKPLRLLRRKGHLCLRLPARPPDAPVTVIEIELSGEPPVIAPGAHLHGGLRNEFGAPFAQLTGCRCLKRSWMEKFGDWQHTDLIGEWAAGSEACWTFTALEAGRFEVYADYECRPEGDGSDCEIAVAGQRWTFPLIYTGGGNGLRTRLRSVRIGMADVPKGPARLRLRGLEIRGENALFLQKIVLVPST